MKCKTGMLVRVNLGGLVCLELLDKENWKK